MKTETFDAIAEALARPHGRRGALRLLGGAALGGGLGLAGLAGADARQGNKNRKNGKKRRPDRPATCPSGRTVANVNVPGIGTIARTPVLTQGQVYLFQASGFAPTNATHGQDAEYDFILAEPGNLTKVTDAGPVDFGISIDGAAPNWGPYNAGHVYETRVNGAGRAVTLQLLDSIYADNSGSINVKVSCV